jgi:hypothetical protein
VTYFLEIKEIHVVHAWDTVASLKMRGFNFFKIKFGALNILGAFQSKNIRQGQNNYKLLYCSPLRMHCMKPGLHTINIEY